MQTPTTQAEELINAVPEQAWPLIELLFNVTIVTTIIWLGYTVFVMMRRNASNLTPVHATSADKSAEPDFLSVDNKARKEAIKQGEAFDKELDKRDAADEKAKLKATKRKESKMQRAARLVSLIMALFSLATMITGTIWQVTIMGRIWEQYSATERLVTIIQKYPLGVVIALFVIGYNIFNTVVSFREKDA